MGTSLCTISGGGSSIGTQVPQCVALVREALRLLDVAGAAGSLAACYLSMALPALGAQDESTFENLTDLVFANSGASSFAWNGCTDVAA